MRIDLNNITKRFGALHALRSVSLTFPTGDRVALIGPNGSGKTTLTRAIMGLIAHEGSVSLDGQPAAQVRPQLAPAIAYVPQVAPAMAVTVRDLIRTVAQVRNITVASVIELTDALDLPVEPIARSPFRGLSGGMKQKLLIALALASRPRLILLDEPTASLDARARARFAELERTHLAGATVLLCSHRLDELRTMATRVVALRDGEIAHDGPAATYLDEHTQTVVELLPSSSSPAPWLVANGFSPASAGWWVRRIPRSEKLPLVQALNAQLGSELSDLVVRDLERVDPGVRPAASNQGSF